MLVVTRKPSQSIVIGDDIEVVVVSVRGEQVRLGIRAPKSIPVHRKEVWNKINRCVGEDGPEADANSR